MDSGSRRPLLPRYTSDARLGASTMKVVREFGMFLWEGRKFWLIPIAAALLLVGGLVVFSSTSPLSPFIYPFF